MTSGRKSFELSRTWVDSALLGNQDVASLSWASESFWASGAATTKTISHKATTSHLVRLPQMSAATPGRRRCCTSGMPLPVLRQE